MGKAIDRSTGFGDRFRRLHAVPDGMEHSVHVTPEKIGAYPDWDEPEIRLKTMRRQRPLAPEQMPTVRDELIEGWVTHLWPTHDRTGTSYIERESNLNSILSASLWWVGDEMCDLLYAAAPQIPEEVKIEHLSLPSEHGIVFLQKPWTGVIDCITGEPDLTVDLFVWSRTTVTGMPCLSIHLYRFIDFGVMGQQDLELVSALRLTRVFANNLPVRPATYLDGESGWVIAAGHWAPLGRSDWAEDDELGSTRHYIENAKEMLGIDSDPDVDLASGLSSHWTDSAIEDRRLVAAFFSLLQSDRLATVQEKKPSRPVVKQAEKRQRKDPNVTIPSTVKLVILRRPKTQPNPDREVEGRHFSHRFTVRPHPRWQACGPRHSERKLIMVPGHVRGPEDAPFVPKEVVNVWRY
jgi:hypothetical protein